MSGQHVIVMTDVVGSTQINEELGDAAFGALWAAHDRAARDLLHASGGREIDKTDGFALLFDDVPAALAYLRGYHQALALLPRPLTTRAAVHVGPLVLRQNSAEDMARGAKALEADGIAKPTVARLMALAGPTQILLSAEARQALAGAEAGWRIVSHGHWRLKGLPQPVEIFEAAIDGPVRTPPADEAKAYRVLRDGGLWRPLREVRHNLPAERDAFVGRTAELRVLADLQQQPVRLVTVVGAGGTGKTRFACRWARSWLGDWPGGVWFCDLSEARSLDGVLSAVAVALGVRLAKGDAAGQLGHAIAGRGCCLVILDNFEQVLGEAAATLGRWLDRAGDASFLVTSRERLHLPGEHVLPLGPLPMALDAVELFAVRARAQQPGFVLDDSCRDTVARIVKVLDGLPLAIELAAARVRVLTPAQVLDRLKSRFQLLAGARSTAARQATLRAAIDWSWDLLLPWERAAFAQCSVFEGGFTLAAAEGVLDLSAWPDAPPLLDAVQSLVDKSLLRAWGGAEGGRLDIDEPYFGMYISIHEYAAEKLAGIESGAVRGSELRHGVWYARFGKPEVSAASFGPDGWRQRRALARELDNLVVACRRALDRKDAEIAVDAAFAVWEVVEMQGPFTLAESLSTRLLALPGLSPRQRAAAHELRGRAVLRSGGAAEAEAELRQALALRQQLGDRAREGCLLGTLGQLSRNVGRMDEARELLETSLGISREQGDRRLEGLMLVTLGLLHGNQGRVEEARAHYDLALEIYQAAQSRLEQGDLHDFLGVLHAEQGRLDVGRAHFDAALAISRELGDRVAEGQVVNNLGCLAQEQKRLDEARSHFEACLAIHREVGNRRYEGYALGDLGRLCIDQGDPRSAEAYLRLALDITRETRDRRIEGSEWRSLGDLYLTEGRHDESRAAYQEAEAALMAVGDRYYLGHVHCGQARLALATGDEPRARDQFAAAAVCAEQTRSGPGSELGLKVAALKAQLGA